MARKSKGPKLILCCCRCSQNINSTAATEKSAYMQISKFKWRAIGGKAVCPKCLTFEEKLAFKEFQGITRYTFMSKIKRGLLKFPGLNLQDFSSIYKVEKFVLNNMETYDSMFESWAREQCKLRGLKI